MAHRIDILLATYNGEEFLSEQINSILLQTYTNWRLLIKDDGSSDKTLSILQSYQQNNPDRIRIINDSRGRLGAAKAFEFLLQHSQARYVAFCDQDDIWSENKLKQQLEAMKDAETGYGKNCPILVHSDLLVMDGKGHKLADSFWRYQKLDPFRMSRFERLLVQNYVTGCTVLINRSLVELALPVPEKAVMHDWWLALLAKSEGYIISMKQCTVQYRQHGKNDIGAKKWGMVLILRTLLQERKQIRQQLLKTYEQAKALCASESLENNREVVVEYVRMFESGWLQRRWIMMKMGFFKNGLLRNIAMLIFL